MRVITRLTQAQEAAAEFVHLYGREWRREAHPEDYAKAQAIRELLSAGSLGPLASALDDAGWYVAPVECGACRRKAERVVEVAGGDVTDSDVRFLCGDCLREALAVLGGGLSDG